MKFSTVLVATTALLTGVNAGGRYVKVHSSDLCWRVCLPEGSPCPKGWHGKNFGQCQTCCKDDDDDDSVVDKLDMFWQA